MQTFSRYPHRTACCRGRVFGPQQLNLLPSFLRSQEGEAWRQGGLTGRRTERRRCAMVGELSDGSLKSRRQDSSEWSSTWVEASNSWWLRDLEKEGAAWSGEPELYMCRWGTLFRRALESRERHRP